MNVRFASALVAVAIMGAASAASAAQRVHHQAASQSQTVQTTADGEVFMQPRETEGEKAIFDRTEELSNY
jgi:opacity protein-like surface antigen